jgi:hypothetical protein
MTPTANHAGLELPGDVPPQPVLTGILPRKPSFAYPPKVRRGRSVEGPSRKGESVPDGDTVMAYVQDAMRGSDPEQALADRLCVDQKEQQARFAALPAAALQDDWILMRHQYLLQMNQATHDAAVHVVRLLKRALATS